MKKQLLIGLLLLSLCQATDFFQTVSPLFRQENHGYFFFNYHHLKARGEFNNPQREFFSFPMGVMHTLVSGVQAGLFFHFVKGFNFENGQPLVNDQGRSFGQFGFDINFSWDDAEYNSTKGLLFRFVIKGGVPFNQSSLENLNEPFSTELATADFYPVLPNKYFYSLGYAYNKRFLKRSFVTFNARYVYVLSEDEEDNFVTNIFPFRGPVLEQDGTNTSGNKVTNRDFSFFGLEQFFTRWFWRQEGQDPYADKADDYFELCISIDTFINTDYYIREKKVIMGFKPFVELSLQKRFTSAGLMKTRLILTPGIWVKLSRTIRFLLGVNKILYHEPGFNFDNSIFLSTRLAY